MGSFQNTLIVILLFIVTLSCSSYEVIESKNKLISGTYYNRFSEKIELKTDTTFIYTFSFDTASSWTLGKWHIENDTVYLETTLVMDTLQIRDSNNSILRDSLVLSIDQSVDRIESNDLLLSLLASGGQNKVKPPVKLYVQEEKLYHILEDGSIDTRKLKPLWSQKKYRNHFSKMKN